MTTRRGPRKPSLRAVIDPRSALSSDATARLAAQRGDAAAAADAAAGEARAFQRRTRGATGAGELNPGLDFSQPLPRVPRPGAWARVCVRARVQGRPCARAAASALPTGCRSPSPNGRRADPRSRPSADYEKYREKRAAQALAAKESLAKASVTAPIAVPVAAAGAEGPPPDAQQGAEAAPAGGDAAE